MKLVGEGNGIIYFFRTVALAKGYEYKSLIKANAFWKMAEQESTWRRDMSTRV